MSKKLWERGENTFLKSFCSIEQSDECSTYLWTDGGNWGKFNFVRVYNKLDDKTFLSIKNKFEEKFKDSDKSLSVKSIACVESELFEEAGVPIVTIKLQPISVSDLGEARLLKCDSEEEIKRWWAVNSDGRDRTGNSPLFPSILEMSKQKENLFYILKVNNEDAACGAISFFDDMYNLFGLATRKEYQSKGLMKKIINEISIIQKKEFVVQVNLDSYSYNYFSSLESSEILYKERRYVEKN
jgi:hypothetical protein